jgi:hypothetical protein
MNSNLIDFTLENIFSEVIPVANTFFNEYDIRVTKSSGDQIYAEIEVVYKHALELSWVFSMIGNIYYDELNEKNSYEFFQEVAYEAKHIISLDYPKQAVFVAMLNKAEEWYKNHYPLQALIINEENGVSVRRLD